MPDLQPPSPAVSPKSLIGKILYSKFVGKISQIPPFSSIASWLGYKLLSPYGHKSTPPLELRFHGSGLQDALDSIVQDVVEILGFAGAMVATFDNGEVLPVKAFYVDPQLATSKEIESLEQQASELLGSRVSLTDANIARVYIYDPDHQKNLGVQAARKGQYLISDELFDLFTPIAPDTLKAFIRGAQDALEIQQVITIPFFIESSRSDVSEEPTSLEPSTTDALEESTNMDMKVKPGFVGNLFAAKRGEISSKEIAVLSTFAQYVASLILSERRRRQVETIEKLVLDIQKGLNSEEDVLQRIVKGVVDDLEYVAAMVATYDETEDVLPVRALYAGKNIEIERIHTWEQQASKRIGATLSLTDPNIAKVYLNQEAYKENLSVKAAQKGKPVKSEDLFDLFNVPLVPDALRSFIEGIQAGLGIHQVIAVPFFLGTKLVGNLFAASRSYDIQSWEIDILNAFGQQAAVGLRNVKLYKETQELYKRSDELNRELQLLYTKSEEANKELQALYAKSENRRKAAELFGKMAFSASASVHALRNQLTAVKLTVQTLEALGKVDKEKRDFILDQIISSQQIPKVLNRLNEMKDLLQSLHEPWRPINDTVVNVNTSINAAVDKAGIAPACVKLSLASEELSVKTTPEMLLEFFKVLIKNAVDAMPDESERLVQITSTWNKDVIQVTVSDQGVGMDSETLNRIFEMGFTTKEKGLGFGLFWAKDYVEGLGGSIQVESILGQGATFTICLPKLDEQS